MIRWSLVGRAQLLDALLQALREPPRVVVLEGVLGVGKTRLLQAVSDHLSAEGWSIEACVGTASAAEIPFGVMSHLLLPAPGGNATMLVEQVRREILRRTNGAPLLMAVDDAHHLDPASLTLVHRLARSHDASILLVRRTGEPVTETVVSLWKDGHAERFEVPPLDRMAHDALISEALPGSDPALNERLWSLTEGNPLFLRELLATKDIHAVASTFKDAEGKALVPTPRLHEIVGTKLSRLSPEARRAMELIAVGEPIRLEVVMRLVSTAGVGDLEERALVTVSDGGTGEVVRSAHPIYGETIRAGLPVLRQRALAGELSEAAQQPGGRLAEDAVRVARWMLEAGQALDPDLALRAGSEALARGDAQLAVRLFQQIPEDELTIEALTPMGSALSFQHDAPAARAVFARARAMATDDGSRAQAALAEARHLVWMERDVQAGAGVLRRAEEDVSSEDARAELRAERATVSAVAGDLREASRVASTVLERSEVGPRVRLSALVQSTLARTMLADFRGLEADMDRAAGLAQELQDEFPLAGSQVAITRSLWLHAQNANDAAAVAEDAWRRAAAVGGGTAFCSGTLGWIECDRGNLDAALAIARRAVSEAEAFDPFHTMGLNRALVALVHGLRGETDAAKRCLEAFGEPDLLEPRTRVWFDRALAWSHSADPSHAAALAVEGAARAEDGTMPLWAAPLFHDAVRFGDPSPAVGPLTEMAERTAAPLFAATAMQASALTEGDDESLRRAADSLERIGCRLLAAEALVQLAARQEAGSLDHLRVSARAAHLASLCPGAQTPVLQQLESPLTQRELEVGVAAASGATSRDIADRYSLSVRTVDNHLGAVYRKLTLFGRQDLALVFGSGDEPEFKS